MVSYSYWNHDIMYDDEERRIDRDYRILNKGDLVLLTYDFDSRLFETPTIGVVLSTEIDEYRIQLYHVYWFQIGFTGSHYWYNIKPLTKEEFERGNNNYGLRHSKR